MIRPVIAWIAVTCLLSAPALRASNSPKIAFLVPKEIEGLLSHLKFEAAKVVTQGDNPDYVIAAEIVGEGDQGLTIAVWLENKMSRRDAAIESCVEAECRSKNRAPEVTWNVFRRALNKLLIVNPAGLGQFNPIRCGTAQSHPAWAEIVLKANVGDLERGWQYKLTDGMAARAKIAGNYYSYRVAAATGMAVSFKADSDDATIKRLATSFVKSLCDPVQKPALLKMMFIAQLDVRRTRSQTKAPSAQPLVTPQAP